MQHPIQPSAPALASAPSLPFPCFSDAELEHLKRILPETEPYLAATPICRYGDRPTVRDPLCIFIVLDGAVEMDFTPPGDKAQELHTIGKGGFFGEVATLLGSERTATAKATDLTHLLRLDTDKVDAFLQDHPHYARILMNGMAWRMRNSAIKMHENPLRRPENMPDPSAILQGKAIHRTARLLGTGWFLLWFGLLFAVWIAGHFWLGLDASFTALALSLSVLQIVVSNLILDSQFRAMEAEAPMMEREREATLNAAKDVPNVHADLRDQLNTGINTLSRQNDTILRRLDSLERQQSQNTQFIRPPS